MSKKQSKSESSAEPAEAGDATPGALVGSPIQEAGRRKHKPAASLAIDLPVGNSAPEFWGRSPSHSQAELRCIEDEDARDRAQVGSSPAPHSQIGIINAKRAARQLAKQAHRRTEERRSRSESTERAGQSRSRRPSRSSGCRSEGQLEAAGHRQRRERGERQRG